MIGKHVLGGVNPEAGHAPAYEAVHPLGDLVLDVITGPTEVPQTNQPAVANLAGKLQ